MHIRRHTYWYGLRFTKVCCRRFLFENSFFMWKLQLKVLKRRVSWWISTLDIILVISETSPTKRESRTATRTSAIVIVITSTTTPPPAKRASTTTPTDTASATSKHLRIWQISSLSWPHQANKKKNERVLQEEGNKNDLWPLALKMDLKHWTKIQLNIFYVQRCYFYISLIFRWMFYNKINNMMLYSKGKDTSWA